MTQREKQNFYRHSTLIVDDTNDAFFSLVDLHLCNENITLSKFIEVNQHEIFHLCYNNIVCCNCPSGINKPSNTPSSRILHPSQLDVLFDTHKQKHANHNPRNRIPHCCAPVNANLQRDELDLTLLRCLLVNFTSVVPGGTRERQAVEELITFRNKTFAHATKGSISDEVYEDYRTKIEDCLLSISRVCGNEDEVRRKLKDARERTLDENICRKLQNALLLYAQRDEKLKELIPSVIESAIGNAFERYLSKDGKAKSGLSSSGGTACEPQGSMLSDQPDMLPDILLRNLASKLCANWTDLAYTLMFEQHEIEELQGNHPNRVVEQATSMLVKWKRKKGRDSKMQEQLCKALKGVGRTDLSEFLELENSKKLRRRSVSCRRQHSNKDLELIDYDLMEKNFIQTKIEEKAWQILQDNKIILITGINGAGKSFLANYLYTKLESELEIEKENICKNMDELEEELDLEETQILFLDDVFGTLELNQEEVIKWFKFIEDLPDKRCIEKEAGCSTYIIFCSRSSIFKLVQKLEFSTENIQSFIFDISEIERDLDISEKKEIFTNLWKRHNSDSDIPQSIKDFNFSETEHLGFWFCADALARRYHGHLEQFWKEPVAFLVERMKHEIEKNNISSSICKTILNLKTPTKAIESKNDMMLKEIDICKEFPEFFKPTLLNTIEFQHDCFYEKMELYFAGKEDIAHAIWNLSLSNLNKVILRKKGSRHGKKRDKDHIYLEAGDIDHLMQRLIKEITSGNIKDVCSHEIWTDKESVSLFESTLKNEKHILKLVLTTDDKDEGGNLLYWSAIKHRRILCEKLIGFTALSKEIENSNEMLSKALIGACSVKKNISIVRDLIRYGADVSFCEVCNFESCIRNDDKRPHLEEKKHICPLDEAVVNENTVHAIQLLSHKATIPHSPWKEWRLLHRAVELKDMYVTKHAFLQAFVRTFSTSNKEENIVQTSGQYGFDSLFDEIDVLCDDIQEMFLIFAKYNILSYTLLNVFLESGVNINVTNSSKQNALHLLINHKAEEFEEKMKVIALLLEKGCDPNVKSKNRETPLSLAIRKHISNLRLLEVLLKGHADLNIFTGEGKSLLHICVERKSETKAVTDAIKLLKRYGCQPLKKDKGDFSAIDVILLQEEINIDILKAISDFPLHDCVQSQKLMDENKIKVLKYLISKDIDINGCDDKNHTPLSLAISKKSSQKVIECLMESGGMLNLLFGKAQSILQLFLRYNPKVDTAMVIQFMKNDYHLQNEDFLLIIAEIFKCTENNQVLLKKILSKFGTKLSQVKFFLDSHNRNVLHLCVMSVITDKECVELSEIFINNGADVDSVDNTEFCALDVAVRNDRVRRTRTILKLLEHTNFRNFKTNKFLLDLYNSGQICVEILKNVLKNKKFNKMKARKTNLLHILAKEGMEKFYKFFPITGQTNMSDTSVLEPCLPVSKSIGEKLAGSTENNETLNESDFIKCLLECGFNISEQDEFGRAPLHIACFCNDPDTSLITALCQNGANTNLKDKENSRPLHACVSSKAEDEKVLAVCTILVEFKAKVEKRDKKNRSPLLSAMKQAKDRVLTIRFLLDSGSPVDLTDIKNECCLHYCINNKVSDVDATEVLTLLMEYNPNMEIKNKLGLTPLNLAATCNNYSRILCMLNLLAKGAKVNSIDANLRTPLFNVVRCLRGHNIITSLERIARLAVLFSFNADPGYTKDRETVSEISSYDDTVKKIIDDYPSTDKIASYVRLKLDIVSKHYTKDDSDRFFEHLKTQKELRKDILEVLKEVTGYLGNVYLEDKDGVEDNESFSSDYVSNAQVALKFDE